MLVRLILFLFFGGVAFACFRWLMHQRKQALKAPARSELKALPEVAAYSRPMKSALALKTSIAEAIPKSDGGTMEEVETTLQHLARQEALRRKIDETLDDLRPEDIEVRLARAKREAPKSEEEILSQQTLIQRLETQAEQLERLTRRAETLKAASEQIVVELRNLHLALLEASASEASLSQNHVQAALSQLRESTESLRHQAEAAQEVEALLRDRSINEGRAARLSS